MLTFCQACFVVFQGIIVAPTYSLNTRETSLKLPPIFPKDMPNMETCKLLETVLLGGFDDLLEHDPFSYSFGMHLGMSVGSFWIAFRAEIDMC